MTLRELAERAAQMSTLTTVDMMAAIESFLTIVPAELVAFLEPKEKTVVCPKGEFVGILGSIDVFVILVPASHDPVEAAHFFQWRLVEGVSAGLFFEGMFEPLDALLVGRDPQPGFPVAWQFPLQMVAEKVKAIGNVSDMSFLQREFQFERIP